MVFLFTKFGEALGRTGDARSAMERGEPEKEDLVQPLLSSERGVNKSLLQIDGDDAVESERMDGSITIVGGRCLYSCLLEDTVPSFLKANT